MESTASIAETIGTNAREIRKRGNVKLEDVARVAKKRGLRWSTGRVADMERGAVSPTLPTLVTLAAVLHELVDEPVSLPDLVETDCWVEVTPTLKLRGSALAKIVGGEPADLLVDDTMTESEREASGDRIVQQIQDMMVGSSNVDVDAVYDAVEQTGLADERAARRLGLSVWALTSWAVHLWGHSLSAERDRRLDDDASAQKRGRVTRDLVDQIAEAARGDD